MDKKLNNQKGFTLAELLIVVAIIAVLVAIGIPVFAGQLEKSRESVDLSDIRSAYSEVMMAAITGDTSAVYTKDPNQTIYKEKGVYSITVSPLKQKQDDWQTASDLTIGGVSSNSGAPYWIGVPTSEGTCIVAYHESEEHVSFEWSGTSSGGGNSIGGNTGNGGNGEGGEESGSTTITPTPSLAPIPSITPMPSVIPTPSITPIPSVIPTPSITPIPGENQTIEAIVGTFGVYQWPPRELETVHIMVKTGQIVLYKGEYYITTQEKIDKEFNQYDYFVPSERTPNFLKPSGTVHNPNSLNDAGEIPMAKNGDIYLSADNQAYIYKGADSVQSVPTQDGGPWVKIIQGPSKNWTSS